MLPWLPYPELFAALAGSALFSLALWATRSALQRSRPRHSGHIRFAPDGACWFGQDLDDTPSTDAENSRT